LCCIHLLFIAPFKEFSFYGTHPVNEEEAGKVIQFMLQCSGKEALSLEPQSAQALAGLADALERLGQTRRAAELRRLAAS